MPETKPKVINFLDQVEQKTEQSESIKELENSQQDYKDDNKKQ